MPKITSQYKVQHRRRIKKKTDFKARLRLVKSGKTRLVIRKSLSHIIVQFVDYNVNGDKTKIFVSSQKLKKEGLKNCGNTPAAYLTGFLAGKTAKAAGISEAVFDMGLQASTKGSRIYAALKGVIDAGVNVPHGAKMLPSLERINGKHIKGFDAENFEIIKKKIIGASGKIGEGAYIKGD